MMVDCTSARFLVIHPFYGNAKVGEMRELDGNAGHQIERMELIQSSFFQ
jgi:hypothetical protein